MFPEVAIIVTDQKNFYGPHRILAFLWRQLLVRTDSDVIALLKVKGMVYDNRKTAQGLMGEATDGFELLDIGINGSNFRTLVVNFV